MSDNSAREQVGEYFRRILSREIDASYDVSKEETEEYFSQTMEDFKEAGLEIDLSKDEDRRRVYREIVLVWLFSMKKKGIKIDPIHKLLIEHYAYSLVHANASK